MTYSFLLEYLNFVKNNLRPQPEVVFVLELDNNSYNLLMSDLNRMIPVHYQAELTKLNTAFGEVEIKVLHIATLHHKLTIK